jgi:NhaP-type Na+/H+ or K+/H+ antiporter
MPGSIPAAVVVTDRRGKEWREEEERRLEAVQRIIISALIGVVLGSFSSVLAVYLAVRGDRDLPRDSVLLLWFMTGVIGLITAAAILLVQRRRPYSPWVALGLLPLLISAHWVFK